MPQSDGPPHLSPEERRAQYQVHYPDVLEITMDGASPGKGTFPVDVEGRIQIGLAEGIDVDGLSPPQIAHHLENRLHLSPGKVQVEVGAYQSQHIYLMGQVAGSSRPVPFEGPETAVELLRRIGGLKSGASIGEIHVIRSHVADGKAPEVFHVDVQAIVEKGNPSSDVLLQPFDEIHVGQSPKSLLERSIPPILRPIYETLVGLGQDDRKS